MSLTAAQETKRALAFVDMNYDYDEQDRDTHTTTIGLNAFGGIQIRPEISMGIGTGLSYFDGARVFYIPVQAEIKYLSQFRHREDVRYFIYARGEYPFLLGQSKSGGSLAGTGLGFTSKYSYSVSIDYSFTHIDYTTKGNRSNNPTRHAVEFRFGLLWR